MGGRARAEGAYAQGADPPTTAPARPPAADTPAAGSSAGMRGQCTPMRLVTCARVCSLLAAHRRRAGVWPLNLPAWAWPAQLRRIKSARRQEAALVPIQVHTRPPRCMLHVAPAVAALITNKCCAAPLLLQALVDAKTWWGGGEGRLTLLCLPPLQAPRPLHCSFQSASFILKPHSPPQPPIPPLPMHVLAGRRDGCTHSQPGGRIQREEGARAVKCPAWARCVCSAHC